MSVKKGVDITLFSTLTVVDRRAEPPPAGRREAPGAAALSPRAHPRGELPSHWMTRAITPLATGCLSAMSLWPMPGTSS